MKQGLSILLAAGLLLYPLAAIAQDYGSQATQTQQAPPVAQPLVREGDFAIKLAATLDLGSPSDEAVAEDLLVKAGVAPVNGWISDYPVTPEIVGQLHDSIAKAASEGTLMMTSDQATQGLAYLVKQMALPVPVGPESATQQPAPENNPTVINNYYYDQGPPIVTDYPPPYDYVYLYDWVPYPVFWFGFWFPGFFICHNFTTTVVVSGNVFVSGTGFVRRTAVVSNSVIDPVTRTAVRVDPVGRTATGTTRPVTMLRAPSGRTFTTMAEMRNVVKVNGLNAVQPARSTFGGRTAEGFRSEGARKSAGAIYSPRFEGSTYGKAPGPSSYRGAYRAPASNRSPYGTVGNPGKRGEMYRG